MNALFLTKYSVLAASSRLRMYQYFPYLRERGCNIRAQALLDERYLAKLFRGARLLLLGGLLAELRRMIFLGGIDLRQFDLIVIHFELFPRLPYIFDSLFLKGHPKFVLDFDDAIFVQYRTNPLLRTKIAKLIRRATAVIAGNHELESYALQFNNHVTMIPTVVDLERYTTKSGYGVSEKTVIGWIGSPSTSVFLRSFESVFQNLARRHKIVLRCVGVALPFTMPGVEVEALPWSEETEAEIVRGFDIGVMPLTDDDFARGKSGYKLIQYMACGVPALGTALGANMDIIQEGVNGSLAASLAEFEAKLEILVTDKSERERLGRNGRKTAEERYSLQSQQEVFHKVLMDAYQTGRVPSRQPKMGAPRAGAL